MRGSRGWGIGEKGKRGNEEIWKGDDRKERYDWVMRLKDKETSGIVIFIFYGYIRVGRSMIGDDLAPQHGLRHGCAQVKSLIWMLRMTL